MPNAETREGIAGQVDEFFTEGDNNAEEWDTLEDSTDPYTIPRKPEEDGELPGESSEDVDDLGDSSHSGDAKDDTSSGNTDSAGTSSDDNVKDSSQLETLQKQNQKLLEQINLLTEKINSGSQQPAQAPQQQAQQSSTPTVTASSDGKESVYDFVGDLDIDDIVSNKETFNAVLSKAVNATLNNVMRHLPSVVQEQTTSQRNIMTTVDSFYSENSDLAHVKPFVGMIAKQVAQENPDLALPNILAETATRVRTMMGLTKQTQEEAAKSSSDDSGSPQTQRPSLPQRQRGGPRAGGAEKLSTQQKHMLDVL